jgi:hypothetical protein
MSNKQNDKSRTHAPNVDDKTHNRNKSDRYIDKAKEKRGNS